MVRFPTKLSTILHLFITSTNLLIKSILVSTSGLILWFIVLLLSTGKVDAQLTDLPFYYEKNLPLNGLPPRVEEYYYEYHSQIKAHYYNHFIEYDSLGRVKKHVKTNEGLLDDVPPIFESIIDPRPVTITFLFKYDDYNHLAYFIRNEHQEEVGDSRQDEEWKYDNYHALIEHNFWDVTNGEHVIKNPSVRWKYYRNETGQVIRIEKLSYSFSAANLLLSEFTEFGYAENVLDTITVFKVQNGNMTLKDKKFDLSFFRYNDLNPDSMLLTSFRKVSPTRDTTLVKITYDDKSRAVTTFTLTNTGDTVTHTEWQYKGLSVIATTDNFYRLEVYTDETFYERYREEFEGVQSLAVPADLNTRVLKDAKMQSALREIWDPVTYFYRKDTEYRYFYDIPTSLAGSTTERDIKVFPNPSTGTFYLNAPDVVSEIYLYSTDGKILNLPVGGQITPQCPKGVYLIVMKMKNGSIQKSRIVLN